MSGKTFEGSKEPLDSTQLRAGHELLRSWAPSKLQKRPHSLTPLHSQESRRSASPPFISPFPFRFHLFIDRFIHSFILSSKEYPVLLRMLLWLCTVPSDSLQSSWGSQVKPKSPQTWKHLGCEKGQWHRTQVKPRKPRTRPRDPRCQNLAFISTKWEFLFVSMCPCTWDKGCEELSNSVQYLGGF